MTPTATYIAEENCLQELPQMEKPERDYDEYEPYSDHFNYWMGEWREYDDHIATLRKIPCDPSCKGLWADGQKLVVRKDYQVKKRCSPQKYCNVNGCDYCVDTAFPLVPVKSEGQPGEIEKLRAENSKLRKALEEIQAEKRKPGEYVDRWAFNRCWHIATEALK